MLKTQYLADYLKEKGVNSEVADQVEEEQNIEQQQRSSLKCFKCSDSNPELPENFKIGQAIGGGDCFFDSVAKGLKSLKPNMEFSVKSLRQICKKLAIGNQQLKAKVIKDVRNSHDIIMKPIQFIL